jgi:hypothetical protein
MLLLSGKVMNVPPPGGQRGSGSPPFRLSARTR